MLTLGRDVAFAGFVAVGAAAAILVVGTSTSRWAVSLALVIASALLVGVFARLRQTRVATPLLTVVSVTITALFLEVACTALRPTTTASARVEFEIAGRPVRFYTPDHELGYGPMPGATVRARKAEGPNTIYDVLYTISPQGFRTTPENNNSREDVVVFLGDSTTFGEGLHDHETLPSQYASLRSGAVRVTNAAFSGWGTHQVVRLLETGRLDRQLGTGRLNFYYGVLPTHALRVHGLSGWDLWGPNYGLTPEGSVKHQGTFHSWFGGNFLKAARRSTLFSLVETRLALLLVGDPVPLQVALIKRARDIIRDHYRGELTLVIWDAPDPYRDRLLELLSTADIPFALVSEILPGYKEHPETWVIQGDGHATAAANLGVAEWLLKRM